MYIDETDNIPTYEIGGNAKNHTRGKQTIIHSGVTKSAEGVDLFGKATKVSTIQELNHVCAHFFAKIDAFL